MEFLPVEIISIIAPMLTIKDAKSLSNTCRYLNFAMKDRIWKVPRFEKPLTRECIVRLSNFPVRVIFEEDISNIRESIDLLKSLPTLQTIILSSDFETLKYYAGDRFEICFANSYEMKKVKNDSRYLAYLKLVQRKYHFRNIFCTWLVSNRERLLHNTDVKEMTPEHLRMKYAQKSEFVLWLKKSTDGKIMVKRRYMPNGGISYMFKKEHIQEMVGLNITTFDTFYLDKNVDHILPWVELKVLSILRMYVKKDDVISRDKLNHFDIYKIKGGYRPNENIEYVYEIDGKVDYILRKAVEYKLLSQISDGHFIVTGENVVLCFDKVGSRKRLDFTDRSNLQKMC